MSGPGFTEGCGTDTTSSTNLTRTGAALLFSVSSREFRKDGDGTSDELVGLRTIAGFITEGVDGRGADAGGTSDDMGADGVGHGGEVSDDVAGARGGSGTGGGRVDWTGDDFTSTLTITGTEFLRVMGLFRLKDVRSESSSRYIDFDFRRSVGDF